MVTQEEKEEIAKTTVSLSPAGDITEQRSISTVAKAVGCSLAALK